MENGKLYKTITTTNIYIFVYLFVCLFVCWVFQKYFVSKRFNIIRFYHQYESKITSIFFFLFLFGSTNRGCAIGLLKIIGFFLDDYI